MAFLGLLWVLVPLQDGGSIPPSPFDEEILLELTAEDPPLIDGRGPTLVVEYTSEFEGTLHLWTSSKLDLYLRVEDSSTMQVLAEDDDSGGGNTPYLRLLVNAGDQFAIAVAEAKSSADAGTKEPIVLRLVAAPETVATREVTAGVERILGDAAGLQEKGDLEGARELLKAAFLELETSTGAQTSQGVADTLWNLGLNAYYVGLTDLCREGWAGACRHFERTMPPHHPNLLATRANLATALDAIGDLAGARAQRETVLAGYERTLPEDHPSVLSARANLAISLSATGDLAGSRALEEAVLATYERTLPEDHPVLLGARGNLAVTMKEMGDLTGACALQEAVLAGYERILPEDHPDLLAARGNLADSKQALGDLAGARSLRAAVLAGCERSLPPDHPRLLLARGALATSMGTMGDLAGARALWTEVLAGYERVLPEDHPDLQGARVNLSNALAGTGDLAGARELDEVVLECYERILPEDHPDLLGARANLAVSIEAMGDSAGARALRETVLAGIERIFPEDHPEVLAARLNLAFSISKEGDLAGACALWETALAGYERSMPEDHPFVLAARANLAISLEAMGDLAGARAVREDVLAVYERTLPDYHPRLVAARGNLAISLEAMGDLAGARALKESVLEARERTLPEAHPELLLAREQLVFTIWQMGDSSGAHAVLPLLCAGMRARVTSSLALAPRQARETVGEEGRRLAGVRFFSESAGPDLRATVFELTETMRLVAGEAARSLAQFDTDPELGPILAEADGVRRTLNDLIAGRGDGDTESISAELTRLTFERDRLERVASRRLAERGVVTRQVEVRALTAVLGTGDAIVGYRRIPYCFTDEASDRIQAGPDHVFADVLRSDGGLTWIDLGAAAELEELVTAWRPALGAPFPRGIGGEATTGVSADEASVGVSLRERILDPVLAAAGDDVERLFLCADDLVFLVPLEALPLDETGAKRVGDRVRIVNEVSFARLLSTEEDDVADPSILAFGGVDYDAEGSAPEELGAVSPPVDEGHALAMRGTRSAMPVSFTELVQSGFEAEAVADLFERAFEVEPTLMTRKRATKAALFEAAAGKRYVHLATHGWFAPERVRSTGDAPSGSGDASTMSLEERVAGFAPMTLCGLALAGANGGRDSLGRVAGILTAEELCSLDLSQCELAVLSACETNVGIRRAGQGIQSLQTALYAAGARTSVTSLWKVDDAATRKLMERFYTYLWVEEMGKADALWKAKCDLRAEGHPVRDWAAWVLSGEPD